MLVEKQVQLNKRIVVLHSDNATTLRSEENTFVHQVARKLHGWGEQWRSRLSKTYHIDCSPHTSMPWLFYYRSSDASSGLNRVIAGPTSCLPSRDVKSLRNVFLRSEGDIWSFLEQLSTICRQLAHERSHVVVSLKLPQPSYEERGQMDAADPASTALPVGSSTCSDSKSRSSRTRSRYLRCIIV